VPISFADVQTAILAGVRSLGATASPKAITWSDEPSGAGTVKVVLDIVTLNAMQNRETYVTTGPSTAWELSTLYYVRVQVRSEAIYNAPGHDAMVALERIRAGLLRPDLVWGAGVVHQPDEQTFVHHLSFPDGSGRTISAYAFETGFRAVVDFPLGAPPVDVTPGLLEVVLDGDADVGEDDLIEIDRTIERP
jgi:hypothetical protein